MMLSNRGCHATCAFLLAAGFASAPLVMAQFPSQQPEPKHYPWSDSSLSPDARADMVIKELTIEEKISLLHGQGGFGPRAGPTESNDHKRQLAELEYVMASRAAAPRLRKTMWACRSTEYSDGGPSAKLRERG